MEKKALTPLESLTLEEVKNLKIHSTYSSLRRAYAAKPADAMVFKPASYTSTNKEGKTVPAVPTVPTIWYILDYDRMDPENPDSQKWVAHTLSSEISRFLLAKSTGLLDLAEEMVP